MSIQFFSNTAIVILRYCRSCFEYFWQYPYVLSFHRLSQVADRSSCGSSFWSSCPTAPMCPASHGKAQMGSSSSSTPTRWLGAGGSGRVSLIWTMTNWAGRCATITTRTSWPKSMARDTLTSSIFTAWRRCASRPPPSKPSTSFRGTSPRSPSPAYLNWTSSRPAWVLQVSPTGLAPRRRPCITATTCSLRGPLAPCLRPISAASTTSTV